MGPSGFVGPCPALVQPPFPWLLSKQRSPDFGAREQKAVLILLHSQPVNFTVGTSHAE